MVFGRMFSDAVEDRVMDSSVFRFANEFPLNSISLMVFSVSFSVTSVFSSWDCLAKIFIRSALVFGSKFIRCRSAWDLATEVVEGVGWRRSEERRVGKEGKVWAAA